MLQLRLPDPVWLATPEFLKEHNYENPISGKDTAFSKGYNRPNDATIWKILRDSPI